MHLSESVTTLSACTTAYIFTDRFLERYYKSLKSGKLNGIDLLKPEKPNLPEAAGLACVIAFCGVTLGVIVLQRVKCIDTELGSGDYSHIFLLLINVCVLSFAGLVDDIMDLSWSSKITTPLIPCIFTLEAREAYAERIPSSFKGLAHMVDKLANSGIHNFLNANIWPNAACHYVYDVLMYIFGVNCINIYAGINGLEVGQSIVVAGGMMLTAHLKLDFTDHDSEVGVRLRWNRLILLIFMSTSAALFKWNKYPAKLFVGNVYTAFAGAVVTSTCLLDDTMWLLPLMMMMQLINFILSIPQLTGMQHCPRHRMPVLNEKSNLLEHSPNGTLINAVLYVLGPTSEKELVKILLVTQIVLTITVASILYLLYPCTCLSIEFNMTFA